MFFFTDKDGKVLKYDRSSIIALHTNIPTPTYSYISDTTDLGQMIIMDRQLQPRTINVKFLLKAHDFQDTYLLRDELYRLLATEKELYLHESAEPFKRWRILLSGEEFAEKGYNYASYSLSFVSPLGLAESVATTLNKQKFNESIWQFGQGLIFEDKEYIHSTNRFKIYNAGDVVIDPRKLPLKIIYRGASNGLTIKNHTNNIVWNYTGASGPADYIILDGVQSFKNNMNIFGDTNKKLVVLEKGWNDIELSGTSRKFLVSFDYRFYFL